jgi:hypothetical protein
MLALGVGEQPTSCSPPMPVTAAVAVTPAAAAAAAAAAAKAATAAAAVVGPVAQEGGGAPQPSLALAGAAPAAPCSTGAIPDGCSTAASNAIRITALALQHRREQQRSGASKRVVEIRSKCAHARGEMAPLAAKDGNTL